MILKSKNGEIEEPQHAFGIDILHMYEVHGLLPQVIRKPLNVFAV